MLLCSFAVILLSYYAVDPRYTLKLISALQQPFWLLRDEVQPCIYGQHWHPGHKPFEGHYELPCTYRA